MPRLVEIGEAELEPLLDDLDRSEDRLAQQRGMVLRALSVPGQDHPQPYAVHVPKAYGAGRPWPPLIYLHGGGGQVNQARYALERLAQASASSQPAAPPALTARLGPHSELVRKQLSKRIPSRAIRSILGVVLMRLP